MKIARQLAIFVSVISMTQVSMAQAPLDAASMGSYPYFVALDKRCGAENAERTKALGLYRSQFSLLTRSVLVTLKNMQKDGQVTPAQVKEAEDKISAIETQGYSAQDLEKFNKFFDQGSEKEIQELCVTFASDVAARMELNRHLLEISAKFNDAKPK